MPWIVLYWLKQLFLQLGEIKKIKAILKCRPQTKNKNKNAHLPLAYICQLFLPIFHMSESNSMLRLRRKLHAPKLCGISGEILVFHHHVQGLVTSKLICRFMDSQYSSWIVNLPYNIIIIIKIIIKIFITTIIIKL